LNLGTGSDNHKSNSVQNVQTGAFSLILNTISLYGGANQNMGDLAALLDSGSYMLNGDTKGGESRSRQRSYRD
jgi:hypothetical protein